MGNKTELKLLARQQSEQNWAMLPGEETIPAEIANEYNSGVLVLVELDSNQQVKKIQDATRHLVGILKNFSRMREKFRTQEEEIEGWKQSLIYQSQELTRREVDIEARAEELQQLEAESHKIEEQRQEFEATRAQFLQLKEEMEGDRAQLEEAWGRLRSAQQQQSTALSDQQLQELEELTGRLESSLLNGEALQHLQTIRGGGTEQQAILQQFWDRMDRERQELNNAQPELDRQAQELEQAWQQWHADLNALHQVQIQAQLQQETLVLKQSHQQLLSQQVQAQSDLEKSLHCLKEGISGELSVDIEALRNQPLEALDATVAKLQQELTKLSHFVSDQEEELVLQQQTIDTLKAKMATASEYDRMNMAADLDEEHQNYRFLEETLQGQRQTLRDRNAILKLHQDILNQRKGVVSEDDRSLEKQVEPLMVKVSAQRQALEAALQFLNQELSDLQQTLGQTQARAAELATTVEQTRANLESQSKALDLRRSEVGQLHGRVETIQQTLQPIQDHLNGWNESFNHFATPLESAATQQQEVTQVLKQKILMLGQAQA